MAKKDKKNNRLILDDERFIIYQMMYPVALNSYGEEYVPSKAVSPIFGTNVPDRITYHDNQGQKDVDYGYDYIRSEDDKHYSEQDIINRFGSKYHEFQILDNEKINEMTGVTAPERDSDQVILDMPKTRTVNFKKKKDSFVQSIDDLMKEEAKPQVEEKAEDVIENNGELFNIEVEESTIKFNEEEPSMPKPKNTTIPSFLSVEEKPEFESDTKEEFTFEANDVPAFDVPEAKEEKKFIIPGTEDDEDELEVSSDEAEEKEFVIPTTDESDELVESDESEDEMSFDNVKPMSAPKFDFMEQNNAPVDRNITIEEAMRRAQNNEFPELMSGKPGSNRPDGSVVTQKRVVVVQKKSDVEVQPQASAPKQAPKPQMTEEVVAKKNDYSHYSIPWKKFFPTSKEGADSHPAWLESKKTIINETLASFNIAGEVIDYTKGPAFTLYEIMLEAGVNVKKINSIRDNLAMNLQVKSLRILAPIPGKNTVGIEAPNDKSDLVAFGDLLDDEFMNDGKPLKVAMGKLIDNTVVYQDITKMPHALIAGATQSGKSVSINTILVSLLTKNSPENLKLIIVDPKMVEFTLYENIPHLATPIITDPVVATEALKWSVEEMEARYRQLAIARVKNIGDYNKKRETDMSLDPMPYIVIIVDEFNDLVMTSGQEVQDYIVRLAQKARACGIHIILATQRPTTNVVNGTIKANIPCRIAFRVASQMDSQVILDSPGAEELLGFGDMLIVNNSAPLRAQGAYLPDEEIATICDYLKSQYDPEYLFSQEELKKKINSGQSSVEANAAKDNQIDDDTIYNVSRFCVENQQCSINSIQNEFGMGFNKASRVVKALEEREIVSGKNGTKAREILVTLDDLDEMFGKESATNIDLEANAEEL